MESTGLDAARLFRLYAPLVARFLRGLGVPSQDHEDLVQEVFLVAHRRGGFDPGAAQPFTWLAAIALRVACSAGRRRRRLRETFDDDAIEQAPASARSPAEALEVSQAHAQIRAALATMAPDKRALLVSFELEGKGCEAIAHDLGIPVGTVYSRLHTAREALAQRAFRGQARADSLPPAPGA